MQVKLIALAVAAVIAAPAFAQSNVVVYGRVSESYSTFNHDSNGLREGQESSSRLGFKGTEEISSDLSAFFALEHRFLADVGQTAGASADSAKPGYNTGAGGLFWGEKAYVGLQSKALGAVSFGRIASPAYSGMGGNFDAFGGDTIISNNIGKRSRVSNYFENGGRYDSPNWGGFDFSVAASTGEGLAGSSPSSSQTNATAGEKKAAYGLLAHFSPGKLRTEFSWQHDVSQDNGRAGINPAGGATINATSAAAIGKPGCVAGTCTTTITDSNGNKVTVPISGAFVPAGTPVAIMPNDPYNTTEIAISYDFGVLSVAGSTARSKGYNVKLGNQIINGTGLSDSWIQTSMINIIAPLGAHSLHFQYAIKTEKAPADLNGGSSVYAPSFREWGFGYWYNLSKRTTLLANVTYAQQRSTSFKAGSGTITTGFAGSNGQTYSSQKGLELGLRHEF